ncbi:hypothetical protein WN55_03514 [Dufourea novaeangliae]|uniref:Uncharacterized protein n=1 Tax=Dufourea novaeangliae TaxID=178035 RepID=A0A154PJG7_DUFNO|nr:hypothetical protein WN55_03514 [Dufourea novaeangliae]
MSPGGAKICISGCCRAFCDAWASRSIVSEIRVSSSANIFRGTVYHDDIVRWAHSGLRSYDFLDGKNETMGSIPHGNRSCNQFPRGEEEEEPRA